MVPVGKDQVQHIEMTQDIAGKFNRAFGKVFPIPTYRLDKESKVPGIDGQKMSKSYGNTIEIFAEGKPLKKTVMGIVTDSTPVEAPKDPDKCNVFALYSLFATTRRRRRLAARYRAGGMGFGEAKKMLLEKINAYFGPARRKTKAVGGAAGTGRGGAASWRRTSAGGSAKDNGAGARGGRHEGAERRIGVIPVRRAGYRTPPSRSAA